MPKMTVKKLLEQMNNIDQIEAQFCRESKLIMSDYRILNTVSEGPVRLNKISSARGVTQQGIGKTCERLEEMGLVKIEVDRRDKRAKLVSLTPEGYKATQSCSRVLARVMN